MHIPDKREIAQMKVMSDFGMKPNAIAKKLKRSNHTVNKYLHLNIFNDPETRQLIEEIKEREIQDLHLLGAKARYRLHQLLDEGTTKAIETVAIMDRSFQQRRLLEGNSTQNIAYCELASELEALEKEIHDYEESEKNKVITIEVGHETA